MHIHNDRSHPGLTPEDMLYVNTCSHVSKTHRNATLRTHATPCHVSHDYTPAGSDTFFVHTHTMTLIDLMLQDWEKFSSVT